jgi:hypothetical protein
LFPFCFDKSIRLLLSKRKTRSNAKCLMMWERADRRRFLEADG